MAGPTTVPSVTASAAATKATVSTATASTIPPNSARS
jgi:hypothetical protein